MLSIYRFTELCSGNVGEYKIVLSEQYMVMLLSKRQNNLLHFLQSFQIGLPFHI